MKCNHRQVSLDQQLLFYFEMPKLEIPSGQALASSNKYRHYVTLTAMNILLASSSKVIPFECIVMGIEQQRPNL